MIKPRPLHRGDTIGLVGISGALREPELRYEKMLEAIDALGYRVIIGDTCRATYGPTGICPAPTPPGRRPCAECSGTTGWTPWSACAGATA